MEITQTQDLHTVKSHYDAKKLLKKVQRCLNKASNYSANQ